MPGLTWWEAELPTDEQAAGLLNAGVSPDMVLGHEALAVPGLLQRLGETLCVAGHYHFRHS